MLYSLRWAIARWRLMDHPLEEFYRLRQQIQYWVVDSWWYRHVPRCNDIVFSASLLTDHSVGGLQDIVENSTCDIKRFRLLNVVIEDILNNREWNYDFKNDRRAPQRQVHSINDFDYEHTGEVKYVYELSRLYMLPMIAAYGIAKRDDSVIGKAIDIIKVWADRNPFLGTIAWKSGNDAGIRAVNIVYFRSLLDMYGWDSTELDKMLNPLMGLHKKFLESHLSLYTSKGNHHLGEIAGLVAIAAAYDFRGRDRKLACLTEELQEEVLRLIHPDGMNREQAMRYQGSYINLAVTSLQMAKSRGIQMDDAAMERVEKMYDMLDVFRIKRATYFNFGDEDNAELLYPYFDKEYDEYESMMNDRCVLFSKDKKAGAHYDIRNYLLFGDAGLKKFDEVRTETKEGEVYGLYPHSGYMVAKGRRLQLLFDVGEIGIKPMMGHGHSDILSFSLFVDGQPVVVDCGSYQYNVKYRKFRDYFHGVHSHNTVSIDGLSQAEAGVGMFWLSYPEVTIDEYRETEEMVRCTAHHNGYVRKGMDVVHKRTVTERKKDDEIVIEDSIVAGDDHRGQMTLHFHPSVEVSHRGDSLLIGDRVMVVNSLFVGGRLVRGDTEMPMGWYSERYDAIEPTVSFVLPFRIVKGDNRYTTRISLQ